MMLKGKKLSDIIIALAFMSGRVECMWDERTLNTIKEIMTPQRKKIISIIYEQGEVCSGDIANKLEVRPNSMSNALERMKNLEIPLLKSRRNGRKQMYSLTDICLQYVQEVLYKEEKKEERERLINCSEIINTIARYTCELNDLDPFWESKIQMLLEQREARIGCKDIFLKIHELLEKFSRLLEDFSKEVLVRSVESVIENISVREYVIHLVQRRAFLAYLWEWMEKDEKFGYKLLSLILKPQSFMLLGNEYQEVYIRGGNPEKIKNLCFALQELMTFAYNQQMTEEVFVEYLEEEGASVSCGYFIYERYQKLLTIE